MRRPSPRMGGGAHVRRGRCGWCEGEEPGPDRGGHLEAAAALPAAHRGGDAVPAALQHGGRGDRGPVRRVGRAGGRRRLVGDDRPVPGGHLHGPVLRRDGGHLPRLRGGRPAEARTGRAHGGGLRRRGGRAHHGDRAARRAVGAGGDEEPGRHHGGLHALPAASSR